MNEECEVWVFVFDDAHVLSGGVKYFATTERIRADLIDTCHEYRYTNDATRAAGALAQRVESPHIINAPSAPSLAAVISRMMQRQFGPTNPDPFGCCLLSPQKSSVRVWNGWAFDTKGTVNPHQVRSFDLEVEGGTDVDRESADGRDGEAQDPVPGA